eukprot:Rmarinus@m.13868
MIWRSVASVRRKRQSEQFTSDKNFPLNILLTNVRSPWRKIAHKNGAQSTARQQKSLPSNSARMLNCSTLLTGTCNAKHGSRRSARKWSSGKTTPLLRRMKCCSTSTSNALIWQIRRLLHRSLGDPPRLVERTTAHTTVSQTIRLQSMVLTSGRDALRRLTTEAHL